MKSRPFSRQTNFQSVPNFRADPRLRLTERVFHRTVKKIEDRLMHHCDRPKIEMQILAFIHQALGPSTEGIAVAMGISNEAAAVHLRALSEANRIWGQPVHGNETAWYISNEGRHFLASKGLREIHSQP